MLYLEKEEEKKRLRKLYNKSGRWMYTYRGNVYPDFHTGRLKKVYRRSGTARYFKNQANRRVRRYNKAISNGNDYQKVGSHIMWNLY